MRSDEIRAYRMAPRLTARGHSFCCPIFASNGPLGAAALIVICRALRDEQGPRVSPNGGLSGAERSRYFRLSTIRTAMLRACSRVALA